MRKISILAAGLLAWSSVPMHAGAIPQKPLALANPASVHCGNIGGRFVARKDRAGNVYGFCRLPNGRLCEEWALFRYNKCVGPEAAMRRK